MSKHDEIDYRKYMTEEEIERCSQMTVAEVFHEAIEELVEVALEHNDLTSEEIDAILHRFIGYSLKPTFKVLK